MKRWIWFEAYWSWQDRFLDNMYLEIFLLVGNGASMLHSYQHAQWWSLAFTALVTIGLMRILAQKFNSAKYVKQMIDDKKMYIVRNDHGEG